MRIEIDIHRARRLFPSEIEGDGAYYRPNRQFLAGRLPARLMKHFEANWRAKAAHDRPGSDPERADKLKNRQRELETYIADRKRQLDQLDELALDPAHLDKLEREKATAERLLKSIHAEFRLIEATAARNAESRDFVELILALLDAPDLTAHARILDRHNLLTAECRRQLLDEQADQAANADQTGAGTRGPRGRAEAARPGAATANRPGRVEGPAFAPG